MVSPMSINGFQTWSVTQGSWIPAHDPLPFVRFFARQENVRLCEGRCEMSTVDGDLAEFAANGGRWIQCRLNTSWRIKTAMNLDATKIKATRARMSAFLLVSSSTAMDCAVSVEYTWKKKRQLRFISTKCQVLWEMQKANAGSSSSHWLMKSIVSLVMRYWSRKVDSLCLCWWETQRSVFA